MLCPVCNQRSVCPCRACVERRGPDSTAVVWRDVDDDGLEACGHCGHTMHAVEWMDLEIEQAKAAGTWPDADLMAVTTEQRGATE